MRPQSFMPPIKVIGYEIDEQNMVVNSAGEMRHDILVFIAPEGGVDEDGNPYAGMDGVRAGYYCARCYEAQDKPYPRQCWVCKFPMSERQGEFLAKGYRGHIRTGPSTSVEDEMAFMEEWADRQRREADPRRAASSILLPGRDF